MPACRSSGGKSRASSCERSVYISSPIHNAAKSSEGRMDVIHVPICRGRKISALQMTLTFAFPWAFINYYPGLLLLNKAEGMFEKICGYAAPFVGFAALAGALRFFRFGLKHYSGAGN